MTNTNNTYQIGLLKSTDSMTIQTFDPSDVLVGLQGYQTNILTALGFLKLSVCQSSNTTEEVFSGLNSTTVLVGALSSAGIIAIVLSVLSTVVVTCLIGCCCMFIWHRNNSNAKRRRQVFLSRVKEEKHEMSDD